MADSHTPASVTFGGDFVPQPPHDWPAARKKRMRDVVGAYPEGWWNRANEPLLCEYVLALDAADELQGLLTQLANSERPNYKAMDKLLAARDREVKRALQLARAMRIAQQTVAPTTAAKVLERGASAEVPWATTPLN